MGDSASEIRGPDSSRRNTIAGLAAIILAAKNPRISRATEWDPSFAFVDNVETPKDGWEAPEVLTTSSDRAKQIAKRLSKLGTIMYGAYWCPHCNSQKSMFGKEAMRTIKYVECADDGKNSEFKSSACTKLTGYPTWEIDGAEFPGERSFEEFEAILDTIEAARPPGADVGWTRRFLEGQGRKEQ
eukprot:CAMPEP_0184498370 /NCGR_PEP_ID=MMETSP0113_2-20130426/38773_1 /TAXON_ID=91329 /ORGANISM="Norrisiella sphaerica, Strain BC52" /LENGTH=184 /DNA_ID=CAMNT_0026885843 /DNA_START=147 /DNA_END=701 /DNA_ORIENTATION=+